MLEQKPNSTSSVSESKFTNLLKDIVKGAGGDWCGVQDAMFPELPMVLFNSPTTRSTLAVRFNPIDFDPRKLNEAIRTRIEASDALFADRTISIKASEMRKISTTLRDLANGLDLLIDSKKKKS